MIRTLLHIVGGACALVTSAPLLAAIIIPGNLDYPVVPKELPVYATSFDSKLATRIQRKLNVPEVKKGLDGSAFLFRIDDENASFSPPDLDVDRGVAKSFFNAVLPHDLTVQTLGSRFVMARQEFYRNGQSSEVTPMSSFVRMDRFVHLGLRDYPVIGPGSVAVVEVANGAVISNVVRWEKVLGPSGAKSVSLTPVLLKNVLDTRFAHYEGTDVVVVGPLDLVYYDDRTQLRPVYRVAVAFDRPDGNRTDLQTVFIPAVNDVAGATMADLSENCDSTAAQILSNDTSVDVYVSADNELWLGSARRFRAALSQNRIFVPRRFCVIEPKMLRDNGVGYANGANAVLVEAHGKAGCVLLNVCVELADAQGYGGVNDGLQLLMLHSCKIVATSDDNVMDWSERWWTIFAGLHTVLGYRHDIEIKDDVPASFGLHLSQKDPMIRSWFAEAAGSKFYSASSPNGRPAAVTVCGHGDDGPGDLRQILPKEYDCLVMYWLRD
jgi:hypothetical protein